jgi:hypothetical protein
MSYMSGALVRATGTFTSIAGALTDPTTVTLKYRKGSAATVTLTYAAADLIKDSTGVYHYDFDTTGWAGPDDILYVLQWQGTGTVVAIAIDSFSVTPPAL